MQRSEPTTSQFRFQNAATLVYLSPDVVGLGARGGPAEAEAVRAAVRVGGREAEGSDPTSGALLALNVGLAQARPVGVTFAEAFLVALEQRCMFMASKAALSHYYCHSTDLQ